jgi:hypothetical protein
MDIKISKHKILPRMCGVGSLNALRAGTMRL